MAYIFKNENGMYIKHFRQSVLNAPLNDSAFTMKLSEAEVSETQRVMRIAKTVMNWGFYPYELYVSEKPIVFDDKEGKADE
ncbi:hypothetical protein ACPBEI_05435 [Latilactobacillus sakei]